MNAAGWLKLRQLALGVALTAAAAPALAAQDASKKPEAAAGQSADSAQQAGAQVAQRRAGRARRGGAGGGQSPVQSVDQLREQVNALALKDEQKTKLDAVFKEAAEQAKSLETEVQSMEPRERAQKVQPFNRGVRDKVTAVLDEEQRQTLRKNAATRQGRQATERWKRALADLSLTADQQSKADAILADAQKKLEAQAAEPRGADAGGANAAPGGARRGGGTAAVTREIREKLNEILTPEQQKKLNEAMPQRPRGARRGANSNPQ